MISGAFSIFVLIVLTTVYLLGVVPFVRMVECSAEDFRHGLAINRLRSWRRQRLHSAVAAGGL